MLDYLERACEEIDASVFSSDVLHNENDLAEFQEYLDRWNREVENSKKQSKGECKMTFEDFAVVRGNANSSDCDGMPLFWSERFGWVHLSSADIFNKNEVLSGKFDLPLEGNWMGIECAFAEVIKWNVEG